MDGSERKRWRAVTMIMIMITMLAMDSPEHMTWGDNSFTVEMADTELTEQTSAEISTITIYTSTGTIYRTEGILEMIDDGKDSGQTILELQGDISIAENSEAISETNIERMGNSTVLTVYSGEEIFGFYSRLPMNYSPEQEAFIMYGYLEGYFDGGTRYST